MKSKKAVIVWKMGGPVKVRSVEEGREDRSMYPLPYSGGGGIMFDVRKYSTVQAQRYLSWMALKLILIYRIDPEQVHREFCKIHEYYSPFGKNINEWRGE
jgi:hypothetical protein